MEDLLDPNQHEGCMQIWIQRTYIGAILTKMDENLKQTNASTIFIEDLPIFSKLVR